MSRVTTVTASIETGEVDRRSALLARAADYIMERGLADLSLRPLAYALATSARMLMYYFGSKERLVVEALHLIAERERAELLSRTGEEGDPLRDYWRWVSSDMRRPYLRLLYEVYGLALRDPGYYGSFLADEALDWLRFAEAGFSAAGVSAVDARTLSTYTLAAMRGLELDLLTTNDIDRANHAFELFHADLAHRVVELKPGS